MSAQCDHGQVADTADISLHEFPEERLQHFHGFDVAPVLEAAHNDDLQCPHRTQRRSNAVLEFLAYVKGVFVVYQAVVDLTQCGHCADTAAIDGIPPPVFAPFMSCSDWQTSGMLVLVPSLFSN